MQQRLTKSINTPQSDWENNTTVEWIGVDDLIVDESYQRPLEPRKVAKIVKDFDPDAFGALVVSLRSDGTKALIDGGHRVEALAQMGWLDQQVPATIHRGLTVEQEARIFSILNSNRTKPKVVDLFKADVRAGNPTAVAINLLFEKHGLEPTQSITQNGIRSIGTCQRLVAGGSIDLLDQVIGVIVRAYRSRHSTMFNHDFMIPLGAIIQRNPTIDLGRLVKAISGLGEPQAVVSRGRSVASVSGTKPPNEVANLIIRKYNAGLRQNTLSEFGGRETIFTLR